MITKSGATVAVDNDFDVAASYAPEAKLSEMRNVPEPTLAPTDLVSRGKKEPKIRPPIHITRAEMDTIELYMRRLGIPNPQRMRLLPDSVDGVPEALKKTPEGLLADEKMRANMKYIHRARSEMAKTKGSRAGRWVCYDLLRWSLGSWGLSREAPRGQVSEFGHGTPRSEPHVRPASFCQVSARQVSARCPPGKFLPGTTSRRGGPASLELLVWCVCSPVLEYSI